MVGAAVPPASIDEYGDPRPGEDDVCGVTDGAKGPRIYAVSEAAGMDQTPDGQFWAGIAPSVGLH